MTLEGSWNNSSYDFNDCWGYTDDFGNEYAILGAKTKVIFFDITIPTAPVFLKEFSGAAPGISGASSIWRDFKTYDKYAYAVADQGSEGLMVFDLGDIHNGNITKVFQSNSSFARAHNIFIDVPEGKLYAIGSNTQNNGLIVFDIEDDPSNPIELASVSIPGGYIHDAYVLNNIAYCSSGYDGLYVIDMSVPTAPLLKSFDESAADGYNHSNWPFDNGNKMIVAEEVPTGLRLGIFDISNQNNISYTSAFRHPINTGVSGFTTYHNPYMVGDYAVISSYEDGITIMDLTNPSSTFKAAHYDTYPSNTNYNGYQGCWGAYPYFPSGTIIGSDISTGLYVLSTSLTMTNTCTNGVKDDFEIDVDCGGFCNTCECSSPRDIIFNDTGLNTIQISWTTVNTATAYEIRYREEGTSMWNLVTSNTNTISIPNLTQSTVYEFQIRSDCGNRLTPYGTTINHVKGKCQERNKLKGVHSSGIYVADKFIISEASIQIGSNVEYLAGDSIILESPFMVESNTDLLIEVNKPCGVAPLLNQNEIQKFTQIDPPVMNDVFSLVVNKGADVVYIVCNDSTAGDYIVNFQNQAGKTIHKMRKSSDSKLLKFPLSSDLDKCIINQGGKTYVLSIQ